MPASSQRCSFFHFLASAVAGLASFTIASAQTMQLKESYSPGYQYHVSTRVSLSGKLVLPAEKGKSAPTPLAISGESAIEYDERIFGLEADGQVKQTIRIYRRMDFQRKVGDSTQSHSLRPEVRRLVILRNKDQGVPFSPDGPLTWGEIDLVRTDVFTPALAGLLTDKAVQPGDRWIASESAVRSLTDLERIEEGRIECHFEQYTNIENRKHARIAFAGSVRGTNEDGPNRQRLDGYFYFDLESNHLSYISLNGVNTPLDKDGKEMGRIEGTYVLTRQAHQRSKDLSDEALRGVILEPTDDNTLLLYDNPDLGVRFLYPRRWRVGGIRGRQLTIDSTDGSGILVTFEPLATLPTATQFQTESREWLQKQKAKIHGIGQPTRLQGPPKQIDHFAYDVELAGRRGLLDYFVIRQDTGGATLAARLQTHDQTNLRKEVDRIVRTMTIVREQKR